MSGAGNAPLDVFYAARVGALNRVVHFFDNSGASVDVLDADGNSTLYYAVLCGHDNVVTYLLERGARFDKRERLAALKESTLKLLRTAPLLRTNYIMRSRGVARPRVAVLSANQILRLQGLETLSAEERQTYFKTVHDCARIGRADVLKQFIENGADLDVPDANGCTPLHYALVNNHHEIIELLMRYGAFNMSLAMRSAVNNDLFADVVFVTSGADARKLFGHSWLFKVRVPRYYHHVILPGMLDAMQQQQRAQDSAAAASSSELASSEQTRIYVNVDVSHEVFMPFLQCVYTDYCVLHQDNVVYLRSMATLYDFERLSELCDKRLECSPSKLGEAMMALVDDAESGDVCFTCHDQRIFVHRLILSVRSEYFRIMFSSGMRESSAGEIDLSHITPEQLGALVSFIYSCGFSKPLPAESYVELLSLADQFLLSDMKLSCESAVIRGSVLDPEAALSLLIYSVVYSCANLKAACLNYIKHNQDRCMRCQAFATMAPEYREIITGVLFPEEAARRQAQLDAIAEYNRKKPAVSDAASSAADGDAAPSGDAALRALGERSAAKKKRAAKKKNKQRF